MNRALYEIQELLETRGYSGKHLQQANADRIRSMTDEELAEWLWFKVGKCPPFDVCPSQCIPCEAKDCWLDWLRQEAESCTK